MQLKTNGEGQPLVLVPGGLTGWISWDPFVDSFAVSNQVVQVQLLNVQYGLEDKALPENYSVTTESAALAATLDSLDLKTKANFIGWSYGGMVLLDYALTHPEKINTLTLIEPPAWWIIRNQVNNDPKLKAADDFLSSVPSTTATINEDDLEKFLAFAGFARPDVSIRELPQWNAWVNFRRSLRNNSAVYKHQDDSEKLKKFSRPVLLVKGTGSAYFLHLIMDRCSQLFPSSKLVEFPGGHAPHIVSRDQFLNAVDSLWSPQ